MGAQGGTIGGSLQEPFTYDEQRTIPLQVHIGILDLPYRVDVREGEPLLALRDHGLFAVVVDQAEWDGQVLRHAQLCLGQDHPSVWCSRKLPDVWELRRP